MNHVEEQKNELEALSEIYYNEIKVRSNKPPLSFSIQVRPQASNYEEPEMLAADDDDDDDGDSDDDDCGGDSRLQCPTVDLLFELPSKYPETKPSIQILDSQNLEEEEISELLKILDKKCEESIGSVMIFTLVSDIVEWLSSKAEREANEIEEAKTRKLEELEAEEKKKCHGVPVTVESFLAWKAKFDAELLKARLEQQKKMAEQNPTGQKRLTGREMFETDKELVESDLNFVDDLDQDALEQLLQQIDPYSSENEDDAGVDEDEEGSEDYDSEEDEDEEFDCDEESSEESDDGTKGKGKHTKAATKKK